MASRVQKELSESMGNKLAPNCDSISSLQEPTIVPRNMLKSDPLRIMKCATQGRAPGADFIEPKTRKTSQKP